MNKYILVVILTILVSSLGAQGKAELSFEFQAYPTGLIPGVRYSKKLNNNDQVLLRLGYNWFRHRDLGVHDDERGGGIGGTLGYVKYFNDSNDRWNIGLKTDVWFNEVDWRDDITGGTSIQGETSITVIQPTAELGYTFLMGEQTVLIPSIAFGFEWNVKTDGEPTGEGAILLLGIQIGKRF